MREDLESRLHQLELKCRRPVEHLLAGEYRSVFRGRGIEFEDVRPYQPGDDVRTMDWKVTARTGEPHIKRYVEEREQFIYLLVDLSASITEGGEGKRRETITELCSLLTMAAVKNQDRIGLVLFSDAIEHVIAPGKGRSQAMRVMDALANFRPRSKGTNFPAVLARFGHMARKYSIAFVVSDFLAEGYLDELQALSIRHDMNAVHIQDTPLGAGPVAGLVRTEDAESGSQRVVAVDAAAPPQIAHAQRIRHEMSQIGVHLMELEVGADCVETLARFFHARQRLALDETGG